MKTFRKKSIALYLAEAIGVGSLIAVSPMTLAQQDPAPTQDSLTVAQATQTPPPSQVQGLGLNPTPDVQKLERVTVTGSSIKRTQTEGALPVLTLDRAYIEQSGATSATELIQSLPAVQNFVAESASINGAGAGSSTASLHALPSKYTLVLIDGMRSAGTALFNGFGGGFGVNIESIPLDAVDHVEILLDGASSVYGSDAIAGVINFILKKNSTAGNAYGQVTWPQHGGGGGWEAGISKGFGDLDKDGWNINGTFGFQHQDKLEASQRDVSKQGALFPFSSGGVNYLFNNATSNTEPANLTFQARPKGQPNAPLQNYSLNPYYTKNGNCGSPFASVLLDPTGNGALSAIGASCRFNYAAFVEDLPEYDRASFIGKGYLKLGESATLWALVGLSQFDQKAQYAPPAQPFPTSTTVNSSIYNSYVQTFLDANGLVNPSNKANVGYRGKSLGGRTDDYITDWQQWAVGIDGSWMGWDYNAKAVNSISKFTDNAAGGYAGSTCFFDSIASGKYDPVLSTGQAAVTPCILGSEFSKSKSTLNNVHVGAQHDFFDLPGGPTILAVGADWYQQKYSVDYSDLFLVNSGYSTQPDTPNYPIGGNYGQVPFGASRDNWAVFAEWYVPILKNLEVTASIRYDKYDKTDSNWVFSPVADPVTGLQNQIPNQSLGNTFNDTTGKISVRWLPVDSLLLRGSYGTGFRAPAISDIAGALAFGGSTTNSYTCPFPGSAGCLPGSAQYDLLAGPNGLSGAAGLKPEKSKQYTAGGVWDIGSLFKGNNWISGMSLAADYWHVKITDQVLSGGITEQQGFGNPQQYAGLFVNPFQDPAGFTTIAFEQLPFNGGEAKFSGVDYSFLWKMPTAWGPFSVNWTGTHMLQAEYNYGAGLPFNTDLGAYGPDQQVVFRNTMQVILALQTGDWLNSLTYHYKSGYTDQGYDAGSSVFLLNPDGSQGKSVAFCCLNVPSYYTFDWQTAYNVTKDFRVTVGVTNLFDKDPPLSLQTGGGGNQVGYDGRYADPIGRAFYLRGGFRF